jgi:Uma2 family endonuclease
MTVLVNDPRVAEAVLAKRRGSGLDRFDEMWDGVYVVAPIANNEHQHISTRLSAALMFVEDSGLGRVFCGANVSDLDADWTKNYRVPDVLVFLNGNPAEDRHTHWFGGPDFAVEIVSPQDRSRDKLDFYARVGVRELLIVDRDPWQLELFRLSNGHLQSVGISTLANSQPLESHVVPLTLRLAPGDKRPAIAVTSRDGHSWTI